MRKAKGIGLFLAGLAGVALLYYYLFAYSPALATLVLATAIVYLVVKYIVWFARRVKRSRADRLKRLDL